MVSQLAVQPDGNFRTVAMSWPQVAEKQGMSGARQTRKFGRLC
jgi:hypothetical protein